MGSAGGRAGKGAGSGRVRGWVKGEGRHCAGAARTPRSLSGSGSRLLLAGRRMFPLSVEDEMV